MSRGPDEPGDSRRATKPGYDGPGDRYDGPGDGYDGQRSGYDGPGGGHQPTGSYDGPRKYDGPTVETPTLPGGKPRST